MFPRRQSSRSAAGAATVPTVPAFARTQEYLALGLTALLLLGASTPPASALDACTLPQCARVTEAQVAKGTRDIIWVVDELGGRWTVVVEPNVARDGSRSGPRALVRALEEGKAAVVRTQLNNETYLCSGDGFAACIEIPLW